MIVEITGIPGSGKSTLAKGLGQLLKDRNESFTNPTVITVERSGGDAVPRFVKKRRERELLYRFYRFTALNPDFFRKIEFGFSGGSIKKFLFYLSCAQFQYAKDLGSLDEMIFMDEGFINHSVALCPSHGRREELLDIVESIPLIDAVIFVNTPAALGFERVSLRRGGGDEMRERTIKKFGDLSAFEERQSNMKAAVDAYKTRCPYVFEIDASQPISKFLPQLADDLTSVRDRLRN